METKVSDICVFMNEFAPVAYAEKWDNPGLLLGHVEAPVHKIMVALDLMPEVAEQAIEEGVDMVVTHHPFYFSLPKTLAVTDTKMEMTYELIKHDIAVYAAHTNLDAAKGGVNDVLAADLPLGELQEGDLLVFENTGAYSMLEGMSFFLSHELPGIAVFSPEEGGSAWLRRPMESWEMNFGR